MHKGWAALAPVLVTAGFYAGWEVSRKYFKENMKKCSPLLVDSVTRVVYAALADNATEEQVRERAQMETDFLGLVFPEVVKGS